MHEAIWTLNNISAKTLFRHSASVKCECVWVCVRLCVWALVQIMRRVFCGSGYLASIQMRVWHTCTYINLIIYLTRPYECIWRSYIWSPRCRCSKRHITQHTTHTPTRAQFFVVHLSVSPTTQQHGHNHPPATLRTRAKTLCGNQDKPRHQQHTQWARTHAHWNERTYAHAHTLARLNTSRSLSYTCSFSLPRARFLFLAHALQPDNFMFAFVSVLVYGRVCACVYVCDCEWAVGAGDAWKPWFHTHTHTCTTLSGLLWLLSQGRWNYVLCVASDIWLCHISHVAFMFAEENVGSLFCPEHVSD